MKGVPVASGGSPSLRATILVPTFDHGPTLRYSLASALAQTVEEIEVIVVGDGAPPGTDELMGELCAGDPRLSFVPHPKGPRNGEAYRDGILARARGEIVCYLADDDLWFPDHVETMLELLAEADFAHGLPLRIEPDGTVAGWIVDLEQELFRDEILAGRNRIPLTCGAHTLAAYRRLPEGWTTTPAGIPTDVHFWQKLMGLPGLQMVSGTRPTSLHFPSPDRRAWSGVQRVEELERWWKRVREPGERVQLLEETLDYVVRDRARVEAHVLWLGRVQEALEQAQLALDRVYASLTWRLRERLLAIPLVRAAARTLGRRRRQ